MPSLPAIDASSLLLIADLPTVTQSKADPLDTLIYVAIVLFFLSAITEKVTQLTRSYPDQTRWISIATLLSLVFLTLLSWLSPLKAGCFEPATGRNLSGTQVFWLMAFSVILLSLVILHFDKPAKALNPKTLGRLLILQHVEKNAEANEEKKAREITLLSFMLGFVISFLFNVDILTLLSNPGNAEFEFGRTSPFLTSQTKWWRLNGVFFDFDFKSALGLAITGFFLAFGSKFFHDLLDMLLQIKNLKRKMNDKESYEAETIAEFDEYIKLTEGELARQALEQNKDWMSKLTNYVSAYVGIDSSGSKVVFLDIKDEDAANIPKSINLVLPSKKRHSVNLVVNKNCKPAKVSYGKINHKDHPRYKGTIGCPLKNPNTGSTVLLTCGHIMIEGNYLPDKLIGKLTVGEKAEFSLANSQPALGKWTYGYQDKEFDIALVTPDSGNGLPKSGLAEKPGSPVLGTPVYFDSGVSGYIIATGVEYPVGYANETVRMTGLIKVARSINAPHAPVSGEGDSGAVLYSEDKVAIGMINAVNDNYTFAIPMAQILSGWDELIH